MKLLYTTLLLFLFSLPLLAQSFLSPLSQDDIGMMNSALVILENGQEIEGEKFTAYNLSNGKLSSFTMKTKDGEKMKFKAAAIKMVKIEPNGYARTMMQASSPNLVAALKKDYSLLEKFKYVHFEQVEVKPGKFKLLQLLNQGMSQYIQVYLDPNAKETTNIMGITGGEDKSYFVTKGDRTFLLKKKKYKKEIQNLYGDNSKMMALFSDKTIAPKFKDFPVHIALYNEFMED